ncbi:MAG TPA: hypothetical protein VF548_14120 [Allosphingosinicella sp.]|jgi:hypothetical protein
MRPIDQDSRGFAYSSAAALAREVVALAPAENADGSDGREAELPPRVEKSTVGAQVEKLDALLKSSWDPAGRWASEEDSAEADRLIKLVGDGYSEAVSDLIARYGPYCAYCESAEPAGLSADPVKPAALFPAEAFDPANLLLACAPCRERKQAALTRAGGALSGAGGPIVPLWPHLYWRDLPSPSRLPFRHRLYESSGGGSADRRPLSADRLRYWVQAYRQGRIERDWGPEYSPRLALREPRRARGTPPETVYLLALVEAPGGAPAAAAARATIDMVDLNGLAEDPGDRRQERRARAWLAALDIWQRMDETSRSAATGAEARAATGDLHDRIIEATGFWGVWLEVFRDTPGFQNRLAGILPGTAPTPSWEM